MKLTIRRNTSTLRPVKAALAAMGALLIGMGATSCSDDDPKWDDAGSKVELPEHRMFILNEGSYNQNNANLEFYAPNGDSPIIPEIFYAQNGIRLGDTGQDMIEYKGNIYVSIYGSNYIARLNAAGVEEARALFAGDEELSGGVRYLAASDGYLYASFYGGVVAKLDAKSLEVKAKLHIDGGFNLEGVVIEDGKLYVANSYERAYDAESGKNKYIYKKDLFVVDLRTFSHVKTIEVTQNPNKLVEEDGKIFLISWDYYQESYDLQLIDPKSYAVSHLGYATNMAAGDDMVYLVDSRTDYSVRPYVTTNTFYSYNVKTGKTSSSTFLKNAPEELETASVYMMAVDSESGDIYIGVTVYSAGNGDMYRFRKDGTFVEKFDCGGQNPRAAVFLN